jgi:glycosyltransferase involved in cell wall biosynthesis
VIGYLCNGLLTKEYLTDGIGISSSNIVTGTMSADSEHLSKKIESLSKDDKCRLKTELGLSFNGITYIYMGQIVERKGLKYVLDVWETHRANHKDDKLLIIGEGELLEPYKEKYEDNNGIVFTGPVCYDDIYKYYGIADVLIIPTLEDNWSLVVPEAMACGLPVATSIYNGCYPELCNEGINGKTFDPFQREEVIDTLEYFHHVHLKEFGLASKKIESQYNHESAASKIYEKCNEVFKTRC